MQEASECSPNDSEFKAALDQVPNFDVLLSDFLMGRRLTEVEGISGDLVTGMLDTYHSRLNPRVLAYSDKQALLSSDEMAFFELMKTGSGLRFTEQGIVINFHMKQSAGEIWVRCQQPMETIRSAMGLESAEVLIPCAPILQRKSGKYRVNSYHAQGNTSKVFRAVSRFCGLSVYTFEERIKDTSEILNPELERRVQALDRNIKIQVGEIADMLFQVGLNFSHQALWHFRSENLTVEFIHKDYFDQQLEVGHTVNSIPYDDDEFSFDFKDYLRNPDEWEVVVRLIDFDVTFYSESIIDRQWDVELLARLLQHDDLHVVCIGLRATQEHLRYGGSIDQDLLLQVISKHPERVVAELLLEVYTTAPELARLE